MVLISETKSSPNPFNDLSLKEVFAQLEWLDSLSFHELGSPQPDGETSLQGRVHPLFSSGISEVGVQTQSVLQRMSSWLFGDSLFEELQKAGLVEVVDDGTTPLQLNQISKSEAKEMEALYRRIVKGKTAIKILGSSSFKKQCLDTLKTLLSRPAGRTMIKALAAAEIPIRIMWARESSCKYRTDSIDITFKPENSHHIVDNGRPEKSFSIEASSGEFRFGHEFIHALHYLRWKKEYDNLLRPSDRYTDLTELFTIEGLGSSQGGILCENELRRQFGAPPRRSHKRVPDNVHVLERDWSKEELARHGEDWLEVALLTNDWEAIKRLIEKGVSKTAAWFLSAMHRNEKILDHLLEDYKMDPSLQNLKGVGAAYFAVESGRVDILELLSEKDPNVLLDVTKDGGTLLHYAVASQHERAVRFLLEKNPTQVNEPVGKTRKTPLLIAIEARPDPFLKSLKVVSALIRYGAEITPEVQDRLNQIQKENPEYYKLLTAALSNRP